MEPERVVHRVGSVCSFNHIETGLMLSMGSRQTELPRGCFIESVARRDGGRKAKGSKFIGSEKLFRQIDQNEFLVLFSGLIRERKRGKCFQLLEQSRHFNREARPRVPPIDPIEPCHVDPIFTE